MEFFKHDLELFRLRQEREAVEYEEQLWENASHGEAASFRRSFVKSSDNALPLVNNLPE